VDGAGEYGSGWSERGSVTGVPYKLGPMNGVVLCGVGGADCARRYESGASEGLGSGGMNGVVNVCVVLCSLSSPFFPLSPPPLSSIT